MLQAYFRSLCFQDGNTHGVAVRVVGCWHHRLNYRFYFHTQGSSLTQGYKISSRQPTSMTDWYGIDHVGPSQWLNLETSKTKLKVLCVSNWSLCFNCVSQASLCLICVPILLHFLTGASSDSIKFTNVHADIYLRICLRREPNLRGQTKRGPRKKTLKCDWKWGTSKPPGGKALLSSWRYDKHY